MTAVDPLLLHRRALMPSSTPLPPSLSRSLLPPPPPPFQPLPRALQVTLGDEIFALRMRQDDARRRIERQEAAAQQRLDDLLSLGVTATRRHERRAYHRQQRQWDAALRLQRVWRGRRVRRGIQYPELRAERAVVERTEGLERRDLVRRQAALWAAFEAAAGAAAGPGSRPSGLRALLGLGPEPLPPPPLLAPPPRDPAAAPPPPQPKALHRRLRPLAGALGMGPELSPRASLEQLLSPGGLHAPAAALQPLVLPPRPTAEQVAQAYGRAPGALGGGGRAPARAPGRSLAALPAKGQQKALKERAHAAPRRIEGLVPPRELASVGVALD